MTYLRMRLKTKCEFMFYLHPINMAKAILYNSSSVPYISTSKSGGESGLDFNSRGCSTWNINGFVCFSLL